MAFRYPFHEALHHEGRDRDPRRSDDEMRPRPGDRRFHGIDYDRDGDRYLGDQVRHAPGWPTSRPATDDDLYEERGIRSGRSGPAWRRREGPHVGRGPKGYRRSDERIREDACEELTWHGHVDASDVRMSVEDGEVTLEGTVDSRAAKRAAEDAVERVRGVRDVHNRLTIRRD